MAQENGAIKKGAKVWWSDPDNNHSSGMYEVIEVRTYPDDPGLYDDTLVVISNGVTEAEVEAWEIQPLHHVNVFH